MVMRENQINLLYQIALLRTPYLDWFFLFLNYFDSEYFLMVLIPWIWIGVSSRWGLKLSILLIFNALINYHMKCFFNLPRPIVDFPDIAMLPFNSPGFPSGAAQTAILLGGLLIYAWNDVKAWAVAVPYILLVSFSRLYLGVHYLNDLLGGWILGLAILAIFINIIRPLEKFLIKEGRGFCIFLCACIATIYSFLCPNLYPLALISAFAGFGLGAYLTSYLPWKWRSCHPKSISSRYLAGLFAIISVAVIYILLPSYTLESVRSFLIALWISFGAGPIGKYIMPRRFYKT